jgi:hypothetical protein
MVWVMPSWAFLISVSAAASAAATTATAAAAAAPAAAAGAGAAAGEVGHAHRKAASEPVPAGVMAGGALSFVLLDSAL